MKIKINKKSLMHCIDTVFGAVPQRPVIQITSNFLFVIKENRCKVYAYNGKLQIQGVMNVECPEDISMCIPAGTLMNTVKLLSEEDFIFNYNPEKFVLNIAAGKKKYNIRGFNPIEFPIQSVDPEKSKSMTVQASSIMSHITTLSKIVDWNDIRPMMSGVTIFTNNGKVDITGVNSGNYFYRGITDISPEEDFSIVLHKDISIALANSKGKGDVKIVIGERKVEFSMDGFVFTSVLVDVQKVLVVEKYFDFNRDTYLTINKNDLLGSLRRLNNYSNQYSTFVIKIEGTELKLSSENTAFDINAEEILDIQNKDVKDRVFALNINFIISILSNIKGDSIKLFQGTKNIPMACIQDYEINTDSDMWGIAEVVITPNN